MRILVTGREGQVARCLAEAGQGHELIFAARPELDLADFASIERSVAEAAPDLVISAGAYTAVDKAEDEPDLAMRINGEAPGVIAAAAKRAGAAMLHLSTDYVFDGSGDRPWREDDPVAPLGVYGASKLAGERAVAASGARHAILRTAWVYSAFGANFVKTMLRVAASRDSLDVVEDQIGCPTSAHDLAGALIAIAEIWRTEPERGIDAVYHCAGTGETSWAGFARAIFAESAAHGGPVADVRGIPSGAWPTRAVRPANSRLDCTRIAEKFGIALPDWRESLTRTVARLMP